MTNKPIFVDIVRTCSRLWWGIPHWPCMGMGTGNPRLFQLGMGMGMGMYISPP